jgi:uncharacterized protein
MAKRTSSAPSGLRVLLLVGLLIICVGLASTLPPAPVLAQETNCYASPLTIGEVQSQGVASPFASTIPVIVQGVVVGDFEGPVPNLRGFYMQDLPGTEDGDPTTSDGIFVFNRDNDDVSVGQVVQVRGAVSEFQGQTQITPTAIDYCGEGSIEPVELTLPFPPDEDGVPYLERYEGMLVRFPQELSVTDQFQLGRFGQVVLSAGGRLAQPTQSAAPGAAALAIQEANALNRLIVDDALQNQNPDPIPFGRGGNPLSANNTLRGGDTIAGLRGVLTYTWGGNSSSPNAYRLRPIGALGEAVPAFVAGNPRPVAPPDVGGDLKIASFNVLNYFLTLDTGTPRCGPEGAKQACRGAQNALELERQQAKLIAALLQLDADIVGLIELENSQDAAGAVVDPLGDIVARLNAAAEAELYAAIDTGIIGRDTIRVGIIYKPAQVSPVGAFAVLDKRVDPRFEDARNRPVLAQTFAVSDGARFTLAVAHFKSKGAAGLEQNPICRDDPAANRDCDQGDGQGYWNAARTSAARALVEWLAADPLESATPDVLIIGDLNAYAQEDPVQAIARGPDDEAGTADDYADQILRFGGAAAYSYVFDGQWGYLDHALASVSLQSKVRGAAQYYINADEPAVLDYNTNFKSAGQIKSLFAPDEFRAADHDPLLIGLQLGPEAPPFQLFLALAAR